MTRPDPEMLIAEVTHWRPHETGATFRLWIKDQRGRVLSLASLDLAEKFVTEVYECTVNECEGARQMQLDLWQ
jgi:hypothetical protein